MSVRYSPEALADIDSILADIEKKSAQGASKVARAIETTIQLCEQFPHSFPRTNRPGIRRIPIVKYPYTIFYKSLGGEPGVVIMRVVHSASVRNLNKMPRKQR